MSDSAYRYQSPLERGYVQVRPGRKVLRQVGVRPRHRFGTGRVDVFFHPKQGFHFEYVTRYWARAVILALFPVSLLLYGPLNLKEVWRDHMRQLFERRYGAFTTDHLWPTGERYQRLLEAIQPAQSNGACDGPSDAAQS